MLSHYRKTVIALAVVVLQSAFVWRFNVALALAQLDLEEHTTDLSALSEDTGDLENSPNCTDIDDTDVSVYSIGQTNLKSKVTTVSSAVVFMLSIMPEVMCYT